MEEVKEFSRRDKQLSRPIVWYTLLTVIAVFGRTLISVGIPEILYTYSRYGISVALVMLALIRCRTKTLIAFALLEGFFGFSYLYAYFFGYMLTENILLYCVTTLLLCIPFSLFVYNLDNVGCLYNGLLKVSYINVIILATYVLSNTGYTESGVVKYFMPASYQLLLCACLHMNELFRNKKRRNKIICIALVVVEATLIFLYGSRGPLLCLAVFLIIKVMVEVWHNKGARRWALIGTITVILFIVNYNSIINSVNNLLIQKGITSRTFSQLLSKSIMDDSGRSIFMNGAIELIKKNFLIGTGASSDVKLLGGQYVHNIFLELGVNFGIILGGAISLWIVVKHIQALFLERGLKKDLAIILTACGFIMLMVSGTYLQSIYLFMFMGLMTNKGRQEQTVNVVIDGSMRVKKQYVLRNRKRI
ncbi:O-antigen ligase family protein [Clostridium algidicarnis]|uniref:O-antigen ligase family protein n=1 Tax=Clostridium algidicarnis TaxID=37659 RepID=UPI001623DCC8|nr:O-antigen ligase family protein [Clostridium algidicarnis]MBB6698254.1 O-antigen ligase family protein [Clostridium algidicarnis]